jgi:hypothetical protein
MRNVASLTNSGSGYFFLAAGCFEAGLYGKKKNAPFLKSIFGFFAWQVRSFADGKPLAMQRVIC